MSFRRNWLLSLLVFLVLISAAWPQTTQLALQQPVERSLAPPQADLFSIPVPEGWFFHVAVEQKGVDVVLSILDPSGAQIATMDSPNYEYGLEQLSAIAARAGSYQVKVATKPDARVAGAYRIELQVLREPQAGDRRRLEAEQFLRTAVAGERAATKESEAQAIAAYANADEIWALLKDDYELALGLHRSGTMHADLGHQQEALDCYTRALALRRSLGDRSGEGMTLNNLGNLYSATGDKPKAIDYFTQALAIQQAVGDRARIALALTNLGAAYAGLGEKQKALDADNESLPHLRAIGDRNGEARVLMAAGPLYVDLHEDQKALDSYRDALTLLRALANRAGEALALGDLASIYDHLGQRSAALDNYQQSLSIQMSLNDRDGAAMTLVFMGTIYLNSKELPKAVELYLQAVPLADAGDRSFAASILMDLGDMQMEANQLSQALEAYQKALAIDRALGAPDTEARALVGVGNAYERLGDRQKALDSYLQAVGAARVAGKHLEEARALHTLGEFYDNQADSSKALEYYTQALPAWRAAGDHTGEAATLSGMADDQSRLGQRQEAIASYTSALEIRRAAGDRSAVNRTLLNIGIIYGSISEFQKALDLYRPALQFFQDTGARADEAKALDNIGNAYSGLGDKRLALDYYTRALSIKHQLGDRPGEAIGLNNIGLMYLALGDPVKALDYYSQALPIDRAAGNRAGEANVLSNIGGLYSSTGDQQKALEYYNQALPIQRAIGNRSGEAATLLGIGNSYFGTDNLDKALDFYNQALRIQQAMGDRSAQAGTLLFLGQLYTQLGALQKALDYYRQSVDLLAATRDRYQLARATIMVGAYFMKAGDPRKALEEYQDALSLERELGDRAGEAIALNDIGLAYSLLGDTQRALSYYTQGLPLMRAAGDRVGEAIALTSIGSAHVILNERPAGLESYMDALRLARTLSEPALQAIVLSLLRYYWEDEKNPRLAIFFGKEAVNQCQKVRRNIQSLDKNLQQTYLSSVSQNYRELADLLISEGRLPEAERVLGLLKQQEFSEFTRGDQPGGPGTGPLPLSQAEIQAESLTADALEWFDLRSQSSRNPGDETRMAALAAKLNLASDAMASFSRGLQQVLAKPDSSHARDLASETSDSQSLLRDLPAGTVVVYTVVLDEEVDLIVVTPAVMVPHRVSVKRADLNRKVQAFLAALKQPGSDPLPAARDLYRIVVAPIAADLTGAHAHTIAWSLDGALRYVPMSALNDPQTGRYLLEDYASVLFNAANTSRLKDQPQPAHWTALAMGVSKQYDADLPALGAVPVELNAIVHDAAAPASAGPVAGRILLDDAFTEKAMVDELWRKYPLVHIASHFVLDPASDDRSWLLLGGKDSGGAGYHLRLADLRSDVNVDFHSAELLTLSACETAVAGSADGREVDGLGLLAQKKGAKAVLATLWDVADNSTGQLMAAFYQRWTQSSAVAKVEALRQAQLEMLHSAASSQSAARGLSGDSPQPAAPAGKYSHPYYWAPFILMGNWQ